MVPHVPLRYLPAPQLALLHGCLRPATVRLTAPKGSVVVYDSAMFHRGGENRGEAPRPILAIHVRDDPNT